MAKNITNAAPEDEIAKRLRRIEELKARLDDGKADAGQRNRETSAKRSRDRSTEVRDIGPIPEVGWRRDTKGHILPPVDDSCWKRREACIADPERMIVTYWGRPPFFGVKKFWPFCEDHRRVIVKAEDCIQDGGLFAFAMDRGKGKTSLSRVFCIRAILNGLRQFALFVGAADPHARRSLQAIKDMLANSPELAQDFPEIVYPILRLEGSSKRQLGQTCLGEPTGIHWGKDYIQLPSCPPQDNIRPQQGAGYHALALASGLMGSGITGMNVNGRRPDFVCLDDPQTRQSAASDSQCAAREEIIGAMTTGLASPGVKLAMFMPCTVIRQGDLADRYLSHETHPEWATERCKMLRTMPTNMELWDANKKIRSNYDPYAGPEDKKRAAREATEHYIDRQAAMDAGAEASWPERFNDDEVSAIQNAMNLHADNRASFFAEMQNDPLPSTLGNITELSRLELATRVHGYPRGQVPHGAGKLTAFIDVQGIGLLFYAVCAWKDDFTGWIIDIGTWPQQHRRYFTKANAPHLLTGGDAGLHAGIKELAGRLLTQQYCGLMLDLLLIDSGHQAEIVYEVCRQLRQGGAGARVLPSKGEGARASDKKGFTEGKAEPGERRGFAWKLPPVKEIRGIRLLRYEVNAWKSFVMDRIAVKGGGPGSLTWFEAEPNDTRPSELMLVDHLLSEYRDRVTSERTGKEMDEWHARPNQDNDLWDCLIGCAAAASVQGALLDGVQETRPKPSKPLDYAELYRKAKEGVA